MAESNIYKPESEKEIPTHDLRKEPEWVEKLSPEGKAKFYKFLKGYGGFLQGEF